MKNKEIITNFSITDNLTKINSLLNKFFIEFNNQKNISTDNTIKLFKNIFNNNLTSQVVTVNEPYYKLNTNNYYINDGYGIGLAKVTGTGDIGFGLNSHQGTDIYIFSELANIHIPLFKEGKKLNDVSLVDTLCNFNFSVDSLSSISDYAFKFIPENIKNNEEIVKLRYKKLHYEAKNKHENDLNNFSISNNGGIDIEIHSEEYYLYNSILEHKDDSYFTQRALKLFADDYHEYISAKIDECQHALYMIEHKNEYYKIADYQEKIYNAQDKLYPIQKDMEVYENQIKKLSIEYRQCLEKNNELNKKKNNIFYFFRKNNIDREISESHGDLKLLEIDIKTINEELDKLNNQYNNIEEEIIDYTKKEQEVSLKLEKEFKDFTINSNFDELPYIDGKYYKKVNMDRLIEKKDEFTKKLEELLEIENCQTSNTITLDSAKTELDCITLQVHLENDLEDEIEF